MKKIIIVFLFKFISFYYTSNPSASHKSTNTSIICGNGTFCGNRGGNDDCCCCLGVCTTCICGGTGGSTGGSSLCAVDTDDGDVGFVLIPAPPAPPPPPDDDGGGVTAAGRITVPPLHLGSNNTSITSSTSIGTAVLGKEISPADVLVSVALLVPHHSFLASCQR
jgi:hypothetical protein